MVEKIPPHNHCNVCMKAIPVGETQCSDECREKFYKMMRRRKLMIYFMYGILAAMIAVVFLFNSSF